MKIFYVITFLLVFPVSIFSQDLQLDLIASGFSSPLELKHAGDDRLFVVERGGLIKILNSNGTTNPTPFLDISSIITSGNERGLLGLAFHPDYPNNGYFYVYYTNLSGNTQVSRFTVSSNPDVANPASELQMLSFIQPASNHNGGHLAFGPDDKLYIASGDGGGAGDLQNNSQTLTTLLGKLLRLDVDAAAPYIPADNPFVGNPSARDEIWAYGLRNPWKFSFDPLTDDLWIADVGQNAWEEINREPASVAGLNYGWRCYEGNAPFNTTGCPPQNDLTFPLAVYANAGNRCSVTGGYVYRGNEFPTIQGLYFFADLCTGEIGTVNQTGDLTFHGNLGASTITSFGVDNTNNLYVVAFGNGGSIYKVIDNIPISVDDNEVNIVSLYPNPAKDFVTIDFGNKNVSEVSLININGKFLSTIDNPNNKSLQVNVSNLSPGVYFVKITDGKGIHSYKKLLVN